MEWACFHSRINPDKYVNYLCRRSSAAGQSPLVVYIHGAGSRGDDSSLMETNSGLCAILKTVPADCTVIAPQCRFDTWFDAYETLVDFIDCMRQSAGVDRRRVYLCGASMGGFTSWQLAMSHPDWFAALIPCCGGGMSWNAGRLVHLPIWAFHGEDDQIVPLDYSVKMVDAVNAWHGHAKLTVFEGVTHNCWERAFSMKEVWNWAFAQSANQD